MQEFSRSGCCSVVQVYICQVFILSWLIYGFLVSTYYKSALVSVLAVPTVPPMLNTLEELLGSDLGYGMIDAKVRSLLLLNINKKYNHQYY